MLTNLKAKIAFFCSFPSPVAYRHLSEAKIEINTRCHYIYAAYEYYIAIQYVYSISCV